MALGGSQLSNMFFNRKGRCQVPIFPRFWECSVSAKSCSIICVHIPVMVLLEIHTDCQTSSGVAKECPESHEDPQGKGRRKNKHCVYTYIYIYMVSLKGRGGQGKNEKKKFLPSPSPPIYMASERWPRKGSIFFFK